MPDIKKYLNRDGLEEYNSLLPHSGAEMQTYVNAWLDEHPEATTTVQDGAITEPKLADKSVSLRTLADDTVHMLKGMMITGNLSGEVLTADDAYSAPPVALTVEGKSTQDGTPTPESPVEIVSLEQANIHFGDINILLNLTQALRSLPDGTHDKLSFAYLRQSTREGWAWFTHTRTVNVGEFLATSPNGWFKSSSATNGYYKMVSSITDNRGALNTRNGIMAPWFKAANSRDEYLQTINSCWVDTYVNFNIDPTIFSGTATEFGAWVATHNIEFYMPLRTPTITVLDPIELPFTAAPDFTIWNDPSTGLQMEYVRDSNLVIQRIEEAIADQ